MANGSRLASAARILAAVALAALAVRSGAACAGEWDLSGSAAVALRSFFESPGNAGQDDTYLSPSVLLQPKIVYEFNAGKDRLTLAPFGRLDADDDNRSHADLRQAHWLHLGDGWDLLVGIDRVFWGVAESRHLVDIINQDDAVEDIDGEDKLGQPMVNLNLSTGWGTLKVYVLTGFRRRTFPDDDARLRGSLPVDESATTFDSGAGERRVDLAARWSIAPGDWDIGLSHFHGTSREPRLIPRPNSGGRTVLAPHYDQIDQTGLDVQLTVGAWLWKLEAITRTGHGGRFYAAVGGFEYTVFGILGTRANLGLLTEYILDGRDPDTAPAAAADDALFLGARLAFNDVSGASVLAGGVIDRETQSTLAVVEAERRIGGDWKIELELRLFLNVADEHPLSGVRDDDFVTVRLSRYF